MKKSVILIPVVLLLLVAAAVVAMVWSGGEPAGSPGTEAPDVAAATDDPEADTPEPAAGDAPTTTKRDRGDRRRRDEPDQAESADERALAGVVTLSSGEPAVGVEVRVHAAPVEDATRARLEALGRRFGGRAAGMLGGDDESGDASTEVDVGEAMESGMEIGLEMFESGDLMDVLSNLGSLGAGSFIEPAGPLLGSATTGDDGAFRVDDLEPGRVEIRVTVPENVPVVRVEKVGDLDVRISLSAGMPVVGIVVSEGKVVEGARVRTESAEATTGSDGRFRFEALAAGPQVRFLVSAAHHVSQGFVAEVTGLDDELRFELQPAGAVSGRVTSDAGQPLAGVVVTLGGGSVNPMMFWRLGMQTANEDTFPGSPPVALTDQEGRYRLDGVAAGVIGLKATIEGYLEGSVADVRVEARRTTEGVDFVLARESVVTGRVTDAKGAPVAGARVRVAVPSDEKGWGAMMAQAMGGRFKSGTTDDDGRYRIERVVGGDRLFRVQAEGFLRYETTLAVPTPGVVTQDVQLEAGLSLAGVVHSPEGVPLADAEVRIQWKGSGPANPMAAMIPGMDRMNSTSVTTDESGAFKAAGLQTGPYTVTASHALHLDATERDVKADRDDVLLTLGAAATVTGVVVEEATGEPVPNAEVFRKGGPRAGGGNPWMAMMQGDPSVRADDAGQFAFTGLPPGRYEFYARSRGLAESAKLKLELTAGQAVDDLELRLPPAVQITGVVKELGTGAPVAGALVFVPASANPFSAIVVSDFTDGDPTPPANSYSTKSGPDGSFTIDGLTPGRHTIHARARNYAAATLGGVNAPATGIELELGVGGTVTGVAKTADGTPRPDLQVMIQRGMGQNQRMATTDAEGRYEITHIPPGGYMIFVMDPDAGGMPNMTNITLQEGQTTVHDFVPKTEGTHPVTGTVNRGSEPLGGATVMLSGGGIGMRIESTDSKGVFTFPNVPPGSYTVLVQTSMMSGGSTSVDVVVEAERAPAAVDIALSALQVKGRVVDAVSGEAIGAVQVVLLDPAAGNPTSMQDIAAAQKGQAISNASGEFVIDGVPEGSFRLRASAIGYPQLYVDGVAAGATDLVVKMKPGAELVVTVLDPDGNAVAGASVTSEDPSGRETTVFDMSLSGMSNDAGEARLNLVPGSYTIHVQADGYPRASVSVSTGSGPVTVRLVKGGGVTVKLTDAEGKPVAGASVRFLDAQDRPITSGMTLENVFSSGAATDASGLLSRRGLPVGEVTVVVTPPRGAAIRRTVQVAAGKDQTLDLKTE